MFLLPIARREARETSRRPRAYHARWIIAGLALGAMLVGIWLAPSGAEQGHFVFNALATLAHLYALFAGVIVASDAIAFERREGTLGLLFLTDLRAVDILIGKVIASSATAAFGLLAILPLLAIPMLLGGVSLDRFLLLALELANTLFVSIACGFVASTVFRQSWSSLAASISTMLALGIIVPVLTFSIDGLEPFSFISPTTAYVGVLAPPGAPYIDLSEFLESLAFTNVCAFGSMGLVCVRLAYLWRDRPPTKRKQRWTERARFVRFGSRKSRALLREKLLDQSPLAWLANREQVSSWGLLTFCFIVFAGVLTVSLAMGSYFDATLAISGLALAHLALFFRICVAASHAIAEDRRSGALELLLSTPLRPRELVRGRWLAFRRQFFGPVLIVLLMHLAAVVAALYEDALNNPISFLQSILIDDVNDERLGVIVLLLSLLILPANWIAAGWLGMWLGLKSRTSGAAIWKTFTAVIATPWLLALAFAGGAALLGVTPVSVNHYFFASVVACYCLGLGIPALQMHRARANLLGNFRVAAVDPFSWRTFRFPWFKAFRWTAYTTAALLAVCASLFLWRASLNKRMQHRWEQAVAAHPKFSVEAPPALRPKIPDDENLAESALLLPLNEMVGANRNRNRIVRGNLARNRVYNLRSPFSASYLAPRYATLLVNPYLWRDGKMVEVKEYEDYLLRRGILTNRFGSPSRTILAAFQAVDPYIVELKDAAKQRPHSQFKQKNFLLTEICSALATRAIARLRLGEQPMDDVGLIFRIAEGVTEEQPGPHLIEQAFQPIYEGLVQRRWSDDQLAFFQTELSKFDEWEKAARLGERATREAISNVDADRSGMRHLGIGDDAPFRRLQSFLLTARFYETKTAILARGLDEAPKTIDTANRCVPRKNVVAFLIPISPRNDVNEAADSFADRLVNVQVHAFAVLQASIDMIRVACALERFRLAHDRFPDELTELAPAFIDRVPHDIFSCEPFVYRVAADHQDFLLYSVGWDGRDNGGRSEADNFWSTDRGLDWVWSPRRSTE